jgi:hypothetical protein
MNNGKNQALEAIQRKNRSIKCWRMVLALALLIVSATLSSPLGTPVALADSRGEKDQTFNITFTKWITTLPNMAGIVGGDVGTGAFAGEILTFIPGSDITNIEALYHINGKSHSFTAHVFVTENEVTRSAVIAGAVTDGWLKGGLVYGEYKIISCPDKTSGVCFQGVLHVHVASRGKTSD